MHSQRSRRYSSFPPPLLFGAYLLIIIICSCLPTPTQGFALRHTEIRPNRDALSVGDDDPTPSRQARMRQRVSELAKRIVLAPIRTASSLSPMPKAVASVLKDATLNTLDLAVDEVIAFRNSRSNQRSPHDSVVALIEDAFVPVEALTRDMDLNDPLRLALEETKQQCMAAMEAVEAASIAQEKGTMEAVKVAEQVASEHVLAAVAAGAAADIDFQTSEMAPPFLDENSCLVPGEPVVRVEKALENSRRIFAGIDIPHGVDDVWSVLTDYHNLQEAVPNLVVNDVLELYNPKQLGDDIANEMNDDDTAPSATATTQQLPEHELCQTLAHHMKGAKLRQVGGAKVAGIQFSARTTLEVREWPQGLPGDDRFRDGNRQRASEYERTRLQRYKFPRPFAISQLPTKDITMQSIENDDGEFRMYQGVWRMQPLPGCAPPGEKAMRLTYAVEVSPRSYLPVQLVEGRIVRDLCRNLLAIRDYLAEQKSAGATAPE